MKPAAPLLGSYGLVRHGCGRFVADGKEIDLLDFAGWLASWYRWILALAVVTAAASVWALWSPGLSGDFSLRELAGSNDREFDQLEDYLEQFASVELAIVVVQSENVLSPKTQECLSEIVERAEKLPAVSSAASLSKVPWYVRTMIANSRIAKGLLVSEDGTTAAVVLSMLDDKDASVPRSETVASLKTIVADAAVQHAKHTVVLTGPYVLSYEMTDLVWADLKTFGALGAIAALASLSLSLGSWRLALYPVVVGLATVAITLGASILFGVNTALNLPMLVLLSAVLTMANCIHLAVGHKNSEPNTTPTVRRLFRPCVGVVATTVVGFVAVGLSDLQPVRSFAILMALGLGVGLLLSLAGAFAAVDRSPAPAPLSRPIDWLLRSSLRLATATPWRFVGGFLVLGIVAVSMTGYLQFNLRFLENFRPDDELRKNYEFVQRELTPMQTIEVMIRHDGKPALTPQSVAAMAELARKYEQRDEISRSISIVDVLQFSGNKLPESAAALHRRMAVIETTLRYSMGDKPLSLFMTDDRTTVKLSFIAYEGPTAAEKIALGHAIRDDALKMLGPDYQVDVTGLYYFYAHVARSLLRDQLISLAASIVGVFLTMTLVLRSWRLAAIGMVPSVLAGASCVGLMVLFSVPFNTVTSMMLAIALGIAVDDTIHYLWHYRQQRTRGRSSLDSLRRTQLSVGRACTLTSLVIAAGFAVMGLSRFLPIAYFGGVTSVVMAIALAANILFLPALLLVATRLRGIR